ncbi:MAG TPA: MFS transporter [Mycobacteriales bacterium]|nr:MFS transporter [Mycobacteriales bacterium]
MLPEEATPAIDSGDPVTAGTGIPDTTAEPVPLRRNRSFNLLWLGSLWAVMGIEVADIGYPLVILALTGSPARAGLFGVVQTTALLLAGLPAGDLVDRYDRRRVLLSVETCRAVATASVVVAIAAHRLTLVHLLAVAAVVGAAQPFTSATRMLLLRAAVPSAQLTAALTADEVRVTSAGLAGPPLGGLLYGIGQVLPFLFTTVSFTVSWLLALVVRLPARTADPGSDPPAPDGGSGSTWTRMFAGIGVLWRDPTLRAATFLVTVFNAVVAPLALVTVVILRQRSTPPALIGVAMAGLAVGGLAGTALIGPLHRRFRPGVLLLGFAVIEIPLLVLLVVPLGPWWVGGVLVCVGLGVPAMRVLVDVLIFRPIPDERRGRTIATVITLFGLGVPVGTAAGGLLLEYVGATTTMLVLAGALALFVGYAIIRPELRHAGLSG